MKRLLRFLTLAAMAALTAACSIISQKDFDLQEAKIISFNGLSGAVIELTIENKSPFTVRITDGELEGYYFEDKLGEVYLKNEVVLTKRSVNTVRAEVGFRFASPMSAMRAVRTLTQSPENITVSGYGEARIWFFRKRMERKNVPLSKFIDIFGQPSNYF